METIFEQNGGVYNKHGDYLIPDFIFTEGGQKKIGMWGQRYLRYIERHKRIFYINLLTSGKLNNYLADIDEQAQALFLRLVKEIAEQQDVTEQLKADNQMEWVQKMNNIKYCVNEIIANELIYN